ncbi:MAG: hypothetical protein ACYSR4_08790 [Planctomycetota bacterium]
MDTPSGGPYTYHSVGRNWANAQNTPLRGYKANMGEGGTCVPCIMHWPRGMNFKGDITRQRGHVVDIMATCIELSQAAGRTMSAPTISVMAEPTPSSKATGKPSVGVTAHGSCITPPKTRPK